ncbi:hypothetical protein CERSUDRAFT_111656 [Gelatoporia subvermispora B]|uniref:Uncharacterized protein n=1 Tax=Ceriporiopsis subvermispora (strain B) TaxID=914234 RepID=M2QVE2_CERS8|nr:hypothetical protein CERSUDRAFT_111656 [Gelatoporia subvermispora B]
MREAELAAPRELAKQQEEQRIKAELEAALASPSLSATSPPESSEPETPKSSSEESPKPKSATSLFSTVSLASSKFLSRRQSSQTKAAKAWKDPEPFEVYRAIEKKDITFLMEVRDRAFHLLLQKNGDVTPLIYAMRIGKSHQEVAVVLLGAFSRYVNHLEDEDMAQPRTKQTLKSLRFNLRHAIDFGLQTSQSDLIASFLQTLVMSEGDKWVRSQVDNVAIALRLGPEGKPLQVADEAVRSFATKGLGKADLITSLEDYIANATADLLMMAAWSSTLDITHGEPIPQYYFARDDRVYKAFTERLDHHKDSLRKLGKRLRWQIEVLREVMEGRSLSFSGKVRVLARRFDEDSGQ